MKRGALAAIVMAGVIGATLVKTTRGSRFADLPDVTTPWQRTFTDRYHTLFAGSLSVYVQGKIDGNAVLHTSIGDIQMSSGRVDKILISPEAWCRKCEVRYEPLTVTQGDLRFHVRLGNAPMPEHYTTIDTEPANYIGGWTTWYPGRNQKYSQGFYRLGHKAGKWTYFDERGSIRRIENWHDGRLIQARTANQVSDTADAEAQLTAKDDTQTILSALMAYFDHYGTLPEVDAQTGVEFVRVISGDNPRRFAYMEFWPNATNTGLCDPWGLPYRFDIQTNDTSNFRVWSSGMNKQDDMGEKDDIVSLGGTEYHSGGDGSN